MIADKYRLDGSKKYGVGDFPTGVKGDKDGKKLDKAETVAQTAENIKKMSELQDKFYAYGKEGLVIVLQALDAAGKDGTIKHVMSGLNPQGVKVYSFKGPSSEELAHDYLWRIVKCLPERGSIAVFNRSHYEDVLVAQVENLNKQYKMADRVVGQDKKKFFKQRYTQIKNFEEYLYQNSYRVVKIFLNVSKDTQKERFLDRINTPEKNWKLSKDDVTNRQKFEEYQEVFADVFNNTATKHAPWYVLPADNKWFTRYLVSEIVLDELKKIDPQYPEASQETMDYMEECKRLLTAEDLKTTEE